MVTRNTRLLSGAFGLALMSGIAIFNQSSHTALAEPHAANPRIHHALDSLREADRELTEAKHNFHGHKAEAQAAVHKAIEQLDIIKEFEND